ncbi:MAG: hydrogenase maturation nickel metallochaperone HypA [Candidatus Omnitrophica bacterium]|jgi:Zn finger protein HypA/HybF involved in hydrogenase expression|nr:hydrogenase maturation nickel metallochaperone HypA [Candidatus Omnitrophota bacterium]
MHDLWFAGKIAVLLKEKIDEGAGLKQITVNITLGPFTHVTEKSLLAAFNMLAEKEGFKNVSLNVRKNKAVIRCNKCMTSTEVVKPVAKCPKCGCSDFEIGNTEEFVIDSIEMI